MKKLKILCLVCAIAATGPPALAQGRVQQSTSLRGAPLVALAFGPSSAVIEVNPLHRTRIGSRSQHVSLRMPVVAVAFPGRNVRVQIGGIRP